ncbi:ecto-ADP-ribosyltransferase 5-like isoform X1 [Notamacropus eugenii]|uniref:ecto-ADP-ribosyltransferase 5-like isoform X1 n=1 Tax=Notamacropus eugenii TaxID=9315 RepID=UPI003B677D35
MNCKGIIIATAIVVIIRIIAIVTCEIKVGFKTIYMNLQPNAFDDQYMGCEEDMMKKAEELLAKERKVDAQLNDVWEKAEKRRENLNFNKRPIEKPFEIAVIAYTDPDSKAKIPFYSKFNENVRTCCSSTDDYMKSFHFKAFHFYLTRAIQKLGGKCIPVYRGIKHKVYPDKKREMRFGQFTSSSKNINVARDYSKSSGTLFHFTTCLGAHTEHLSYNKSEGEVLVPPYEVFNISSFEANGLNTIHLQNKATCSNFNCAYLRGKTKNKCPSNSGKKSLHTSPSPIRALTQ